MKNLGFESYDSKIPAESPEVVPGAQLKQGHKFQERKMLEAKYHFILYERRY